MLLNQQRDAAVYAFPSYHILLPFTNVVSDWMYSEENKALKMSERRLLLDNAELKRNNGMPSFNSLPFHVFVCFHIINYSCEW
jgi:hypothetical protein